MITVKRANKELRIDERELNRYKLLGYEVLEPPKPKTEKKTTTKAKA